MTVADRDRFPRPGPRPGPGPGAPSPATLARTQGTPLESPAASSARHAKPAPDPSAWGRVDQSGVVYVRTSDGERPVGSWQAGDAAEGLAHFVRRYEDLETEVNLLRTRLETNPAEARTTRAAAETLAEQVVTASAVGDLDSLSTRLEVVIRTATEIEAATRERARSDSAEAVTRKETLAAEAEGIGESSTQWKAAGNRLREILDEWKTIKGIDRTTDDLLWKRYSTAREAFNRRRGSHFAELDRSRASARHTKDELVARAEALKDSDDWNATASAYRDLMDEWKAAGRAPREADDTLWTRFKAAQDHFFERRHTAAAERDAEFEANAAAKEALLAECEARVDSSSDLAASRSAVRALQEKWEEIGSVPREKRAALEGRIRALEKKITDAELVEWRRNDPEVKARVGQFWSRVADFQEQAAKAEAAGRAKDAEVARARAAQWRDWAEAAENAVESR